MPYRTAREHREAHQPETTAMLRAKAEALPSPEKAEEFGAFFSRFSDARVVLPNVIMRHLAGKVRDREYDARCASDA